MSLIFLNTEMNANGRHSQADGSNTKQRQSTEYEESGELDNNGIVYFRRIRIIYTDEPYGKVRVQAFICDCTHPHLDL